MLTLALIYLLLLHGLGFVSSRGLFGLFSFRGESGAVGSVSMGGEGRGRGEGWGKRSPSSLRLSKKIKRMGTIGDSLYLGSDDIATTSSSAAVRERIARGSPGIIASDSSDDGLYSGDSIGRISGSAYSNKLASQQQQQQLQQQLQQRLQQQQRLLSTNQGGLRRPSWLDSLPKINFRMDPIINFKLKQRINQFGACITLGMDYMSDLKQWRTYCAIEDALFRGRFSLRGSELGWTKSWLWNLGMGEESNAKFKLRLGLNLKNYKAYARLRFRTEPIDPFDIGEGLSCAGKVPLPPFLPLLREVPLRVEYRLRINTPLSDVSRRKRTKARSISLSTGIDRVDVSLDELNFCLEWDEESPVWQLGVSSAKRVLPPAFSDRVRQQKQEKSGFDGKKNGGKIQKRSQQQQQQQQQQQSQQQQPQLQQQQQQQQRKQWGNGGFEYYPVSFNSYGGQDHR